MAAKRSAKPAPPDPQLKKRAGRIYRKLAKTYPDAECALEHDNAYQLLVATILSAQCTDERVNMTTPELFEKYPTVEDLAASQQADVEKIIKSCGFYRNKAKSIRGAARAIVDEHDGHVPRTMEELTRLSGVARKTANVVLGNVYDINVGVVVDTHVKRLANRMGFAEQSNGDKIERDLMALFPRKNWTMLSHLLIWHGRRICTARKADCDNCPVDNDCPKIGIE